MTTHSPEIFHRPLLAYLGLLTVALSLAACEAAMPVALQEPITVRVEGRVSDAETGAPIDSVLVLMTSGRLIIDEEGHASATTDADGLYEMSHRFEGECPGDLRVDTALFFGYRSPASVDLECTDGTRQVNFELTPFDTVKGSSNNVD